MWAKQLFLYVQLNFSNLRRLFGQIDDSNAVTDLEAANENEEAGDLGELDEAERKSLEKVKQLMVDDQVVLTKEKAKGFDRFVFHKVKHFLQLTTKIFHTDVLYLCSLQNLWKGKTPPSPLNLDNVLNHTSSTSEVTVDSNLLPDQRVWGLRENAVKFLERLICF